jgi:predicted amidohydrolase YtcJ
LSAADKILFVAARLTGYIVALIVGLTFIAGLIVGAQRDNGGPVDLIVVNGNVYTADGSGTMAEAVAVQGNKILVVGSNREVQRLRRPQTLVIDAKGGAVLPGFNDAHAHVISGGLSLNQVNLIDARTLPAVEATIKSWAVANPDREWVSGRGWYYEPFPGGLPTRQMLDALVPNRPAFLTSYDGHTGWANSAALRLAKITRRTPNPPNGVIVKDSRTGDPTGVLKEAAMSLVSSLLPRASREERVAAVRAAIEQAHRHGVTSVQSADGSAEDLEIYESLRRADDLDIRVYAALSGRADLTPEDLDALDALRAKYGDDPRFKTGAVKLMADGVIESHTAAMLAPYQNRPAQSGEPRMSAAALTALVTELDRRGWQIMIHTIGDRAIRMALDAFEYAAEHNPAPEPGRRHRLEHIETIDPADIARFGKLGVIASMQPYHGLPDPSQMAVWSGNVGNERAARGWSYGSIARAGGKLAFGSDWPVVTLDPLLGLHVAVNRTTPEGEPEGGWSPAERLPLSRAIDAYTRDAAWASFDEHRKGTLERDMLADMVILTEDIFANPASQVGAAEVVFTIFDGKVVYSRSGTTTN